MDHNTLYDRLDLDRSATVEEIIAAFQRLTERHPDRLPRAALTAYHVLRDPERRKLYDWVLDQYHSGFPVEVPPERLAAFRGCCHDFGFDLTAHPTKRDAYELSVLARRPPGLDSLPPAPPADSGDGGQSHGHREPRPPEEQQQQQQQQQAQTGPSWWPPPPLVLGSRIYHWDYFPLRAHSVVRTSRTAELHAMYINGNEPTVIKSTALVDLPIGEGDRLGAFGLAELAVERFWHYAPLVNESRGRWVVLDGWSKSIPWENACAHFGIRRRRRELYDLIAKFLSASCELALRDLGFTGAELADGVRQNVAAYQKGAYRLPWFGTLR